MGKIQVEKLPSWDLSALFKNINDPKIEKDLRDSLTIARKFADNHRPKINNKLSATDLFKILKEYEKILVLAIKPEMYAQLVFAVDSNDPKHGLLVHKTMHGFNETVKELMFLEIELGKLKASKLKQFSQDKKLTNYKNYLIKQIKFKPHRLTEPEEKILADKQLTSHAAFTRLFMQYLARKKFNVKLKEGSKELSEEQVLSLMYNPSQEVRKRAAEALTDGLKQESFLLTYITNTLSQDKAIDDKLRKFRTPEESRHLANEIDQSTVDAMTACVVNGYKHVKEFYEFKKKVLGLPKLYDYDRYAPVKGFNKKYSYSEAKELVIETFSNFSPVFGNIAKEFFDKNWIDVPPKPGKRGGAFCSYITPDTHPVVMTNFMGTYRDVSTLAHELGHGINAYLMRKQTPLNFENPLTLAETASVFCEMLLFEEIKNQVNDKKERQALYLDKIGGIIATVFRQISMYKFEQDLHKQRALKGELNTEEINAIWRKHQDEVYKGSVVLTDNYDYWWSYIPHFIENPFYVYAYSFGELLVLSLFAKYKKEGPQFVDKYIELLSAGASSSPQELLNSFGVNLKDKKFWQEGINYVARLIKEAKALS